MSNSDGDGAVLALGGILYPINRFVLESFRDDEPKLWGTPFTAAQLISIGLLISGIGAMYYLSKRAKLTGATSRVNQ